ncbi:MAG: hypothetical protein ISS57_18345, partial [Anaerolineales bacterium]|nr:hypothetical protein [Anaerolineales bacterium]
MTTGFDFIIDSLFPSRRRASPDIIIPADEDTLDMLRELAEGQEFNAEELAAVLFKKAVIEHYQSKSENL